MLHCNSGIGCDIVVHIDIATYSKLNKMFIFAADSARRKNLSLRYVKNTCTIIYK